MAERHGRSSTRSRATPDIRGTVDVLRARVAARPDDVRRAPPGHRAADGCAAWAAEDLRRAIVHELEHVRRATGSASAWRAIVAACYWFHPARLGRVAPAGSRSGTRVRRRVLLRRRAAPADGRVDGVRRSARRSRDSVCRAASNPPQLAMANRSDSPTRVVAVLDPRQRARPAGAVCVAVAMAATLCVATAVSSIANRRGRRRRAGQRARRPQAESYDAATIKRVRGRAESRPALAAPPAAPTRRSRPDASSCRA